MYWHLISGLVMHLLKRVLSEKDLGIVFNNKFTSAAHIEKLVNVYNRYLSFILRSIKQFSSEILIIVFSSFLKSKLEY